MLELEHLKACIFWKETVLKQVYAWRAMVIIFEILDKKWQAIKQYLDRLMMRSKIIFVFNQKRIEHNSLARLDECPTLREKAPDDPPLEDEPEMESEEVQDLCITREEKWDLEYLRDFRTRQVIRQTLNF